MVRPFKLNPWRIKMKKYALSVLLIISFVMVLSSSNGSFYKPGTLKEQKGLRRPLKPPSQEGVEPHFWKVSEDILLYYFQSGKGRPILVVHGGPGFPPLEAWEGLERLTDNHKFYYYHQRGCGKSTRPVDTFDSSNYLQNMVELNKILGLSTQIADIERIRRILKQEKIILIGHSYGGFLATLYAVEFPDRVDKMILIAPAGVLKMPIDQGSGLDALKNYLSEEMKSEFDDFLARYFDYGMIFSKSEQDLVALNHGYVQFYEEAYKNIGLTIPDQAGQKPADIGGWMVHAMYFSLGLKYDLRDELKRINAPVLVIHGEKDMMPSKVSQEYVDLLPEGQLVIIPGATHFPFLENPEKFAAAVAVFLSKL